MADKLIIEYKDQVAFHPGSYVKDLIEDLGIKQEELAIRMETNKKNISMLVNGNVSVSTNTASKLSKVFNISPETWLNLQAKYDVLNQQIKEEDSIVKDKEILKMIDYSKLVELDFVNPQRKVEDKIKELYSAFKISSLQVLLNRKLAINFRTAPIEKEAEIINTNLWIEMVSSRMKDCEKEFDSVALNAELPKIRKLVHEQPKEFIPKLTDIFESVGINFIVMPSLKNANPKGMVMWRENKIIIALSNKGSYADIFWFTLFHEIGHVILHPDTNFVELETKDKKEKEADHFASNILIPDKLYRDFIENKDFSLKQIGIFAKEIDIPEFIIIGRLQKERYIPYSLFAQNKLRYKWNTKKR